MEGLKMVCKSKKKSILRWIERLIIYEFYQCKLDIPEIKQIKKLVDDLVKNGYKDRIKYYKV